MSKYWKSQNRVKCPFYLGERDRCIVCTGLFSEKVQWHFDSTENKHQWQEDICYGHEEDCIHYKMLKKI